MSEKPNNPNIKPQRGFASMDPEIASQIGDNPKTEMLRYIKRQREERRLELELGRPPTPEERLANELSQGAIRHREAGNDDMADKHMDIAAKLAEGQINVFDAFKELGIDTDPPNP